MKMGNVINCSNNLGFVSHLPFKTIEMNKICVHGKIVFLQSRVAAVYHSTFLKSMYFTDYGENVWRTTSNLIKYGTMSIAVVKIISVRES